MAHVKVTIELFADEQRHDGITVVSTLRGETDEILPAAVEHARRQAAAAAAATRESIDEFDAVLDPPPDEH